MRRDLGEIMGHDEHRVAAAERRDEVFDHAAGDGIQRRAGLVH